MRILTIILAVLFLSTSAQATNWYVDSDNDGGTEDGTAWATAWGKIGDIVWGTSCPEAKVCPGDTVYISGGSNSKTYSAAGNFLLTVKASGTAGNPITISVGQDSGHTGTVVLDGSLSNYSALTLGAWAYITVTGQVGTGTDCKIRITGSPYSGVAADGASNFILKYLEIDTNGTLDNTHGISMELTGADVVGEIHHCQIHDNYQDGIHLTQNSAAKASAYGSLKIYNNNIYNTYDDGMETGQGGIDFYNNTVGPRHLYDESHGGHADGIQAYNSYYRIYNNTFRDVSRSDDTGGNSHIRIEPFITISENPSNYLIYNNLFYDTDAPGDGGLPRGIEFSFSSMNPTTIATVYLVGNTFYRNPVFAFFLGFDEAMGTEDVSDIVIENNIIVDAGLSGVGSVAYTVGKGDGTVTYGSHGAEADVIVDYNSVYASSASYSTSIKVISTVKTYAEYIALNEGMSHGLHDGSSVPLDPGINTSTFMLSESSGAKDHGIALPSPFTVDKAGVSRPQGAAFDIGAYEYYEQGSIHGITSMGVSKK